VRPILPSAYLHSVGVPEGDSYAAQYPARTFPCRRFDTALLRGAPHDSGPMNTFQQVLAIAIFEMQNWDMALHELTSVRRQAGEVQ
jgi:hypothetical protein